MKLLGRYKLVLDDRSPVMIDVPMRAFPIVLLAACAATAPPPPAAPLGNQQADRTIVPFEITMRRTPCFGHCPTYTVHVYSNGRVAYYGEDDVAVEGQRITTAKPEGLRALGAAIDRVRFFELDPFGKLPEQPSCSREGSITECGFASDTICSSTSTAIVTVSRGGKLHKVANDHCTPSPLDQFENQIDEVAQTHQWR